MGSRHPRSIAIRRLLLAGCLGAASVAAASAASVPYEQVTRLKHERRAAESDLARLLAERQRVTGATARALEVKISLRIIVHALYRQAADHDDDAMRVLMTSRADMIRAALPGLDELAGQLILWEQELAGLPKGDASADTTAKRSALQARISGTAALAQATGKDMPAEFAKPEELHEWINAVARSILLMVDPGRVGQDRLNLPGAWPGRPPGPPRPAKPNPDARSAPPAQTLDQLAGRIGKSGLSAELRRQMLDVLHQARGGLADADHREQAAKLTALLADELAVAQTIAASKLIAEPTKAWMEQQVLTGLLLSTDARTQPLGAERLAIPNRFASVLAGLAKVPLEQSARDRLSEVLRKAVGHLDDPLQETRGVQLLTHLDGLTELILRLRRNYDDVRVAKPFDEPFEKLRSHWYALIDAAIAALAEEDLEAVATHRKTMTHRARDLDLILSLPDVLRAMRDISPSRSSALQRRFVAASLALGGNDAARKTALEFFQRATTANTLIQRFQRVAYDRQLYSDMDKVTGGRMRSLRRLGQTYVGVLVTGMATGREPPPKQKSSDTPQGTKKTDEPPTPQASLAQLLTLLSAAHVVTDLNRRSHERQLLAGWRAWTVQAEPAGRLLERLSSSIVAATRKVKDKNADLGAALRPVQTLLPLAEIVASLATRYGGQLIEAPGGLLGVVARCYEDPARPTDAIEQAVMAICYEINEAGYAEKLGLIDYAGRHLATARRLFAKASQAQP